MPTFGLETQAAEDCGSYKSSDESVDIDRVNLKKTLIKDFYNSEHSDSGSDQDSQEEAQGQIEQDQLEGKVQNSNHGNSQEDEKQSDKGEQKVVEWIVSEKKRFHESTY